MSEQMQDVGDLLRRSVQVARPVLAGISEGQMDQPTPCTEYDVRALLQHLLKAVTDFQQVAAKQQPDMAATPEPLPPNWLERFDLEAARMIDAWEQPGALEGNSPGMGLPQHVTVQMIMVDLTAHAWDLARATGQSFQPDDRVVGVLLPMCRELAPGGRQMGAFGPEVEVSGDAPELDRLLGLLGRDPSWTPNPS